MIRFALLSVAAMLLGGSVAQAATVFLEDFEGPPPPSGTTALFHSGDGRSLFLSQSKNYVNEHSH